MNFNFDENKPFRENLNEFLKATKEIDPEMADILISHSDELAKIVIDGQKDTNARAKLNIAIAEILDQSIDNRTENGDD